MSVHIKVPSRVVSGSIENLLGILSPQEPFSNVVLDLGECSFLEPVGIVALITRIYKWMDNGKKVSIDQSVMRSNAFTYLQRMDFFEHCGIELNESFHRHPERQRFVPLVGIGGEDDDSVDNIAERIAGCLFPHLADSGDTGETSPFDQVIYAVTELGNNVVQHAFARGFCMAQRYEQFTAIAIADPGCGIKESFVRRGSTTVTASTPDTEAVSYAMQKEVSSRFGASGWGDSSNAGVGLTLLKHIAEDYGGRFLLVSGTGIYSTGRGVRPLGKNARFQGTLCSIEIQRSAIRNFFVELTKKKNEIGIGGHVDGIGRIFDGH